MRPGPFWEKLNHGIFFVESVDVVINMVGNVAHIVVTGGVLFQKIIKNFLVRVYYGQMEGRPVYFKQGLL